MAKNNIINNENILIKVDQNNLIYIDPNSVVDSDGNVGSRLVQHENLVTYVNLEADIVPRSILVSDNNKDTLISIAKGKLNFLNNKNGDDYDTSWTDAYFNIEQKQKKSTNEQSEFFQSDRSGQSFGIDSIQITSKGFNNIPQVNITFIDVRGKVLFESAPDSPYNAFFHIPWPIFYLTLKGYYGKAIRYRLHLVKFSSKYNDTNGNFEISTSFVGSTFAYLSDIPLKAMLNCPYMYSVPIESDQNTNTKDETTGKKMSKSSKGYAILRSVYKEYERKGLIQKGFPPKTLREVILLSKSLDKLLEEKILNEVVDKNVFAGLQDFEQLIVTFEKQVLAWGRKYLTQQSSIDPNEPVDAYDNSNAKIYEQKEKKTTLENITGATEGRLEFLIEYNKNLLKQSVLFNNEILEATKNKKTGGANFSVSKILSSEVLGVENYIFYPQTTDNQYRVKLDKLLNHIRDVKKTFESERQKLEDEVEKKMNEIILNPDYGFGFAPTIKNIFAILLANAEVYIRLMKDVHNKAFSQAEERAKKLKPLSNETKNDLPIYPWPEIKKKAEGQKTQVLAYPADPDLIQKLESDNAILWPEVKFVEEFIEVGTNKSDPNAEKENATGVANYKYYDDIKEIGISNLFLINKTPGYIDKSISSFLYEIWERASNLTLLDSFDNDTLNELANLEYENIKSCIAEDNDLIDYCKKHISSKDTLFAKLQETSPFQKYTYLNDQIPNSEYIKLGLDYPYSIEGYAISTTPNKSDVYTKTILNLQNYKVENYRKEIYPFNSQTYLDYIYPDLNDDNEYKMQNVFNINTAQGFVVSPISGVDWVKKSHRPNLFTHKLDIESTKINILNTTYFHLQLYTDFNKTSSYGKYSGSAYLLLNSLPFYELYDKISFYTTNPVRMSTMFKEVSATHFIPYHLILKWGSIYHRYKKYIIDGVDILDGFLNTQNVAQKIDQSLFFDNGTNDTFTISGDTITYSDGVHLGIHPYYDAIFHQIVNGYNHYIISSGSTSFNQNVNSKGILAYRTTWENNKKSWFGLVDNSKFDSEDMRYTILPSNGNNSDKDNLSTDGDVFIKNYERNFRCIIDDEPVTNIVFSGKTFPSYNEYHKSYVPGISNQQKSRNNIYSIESNYRKVIDLIATFSPKILDEFEDMFLKFSTEAIKGEVDNLFPMVNYKKFQDLLKEIVSVDKIKDDVNLSENQFIKKIYERQLLKQRQITRLITSELNLIKITLANPKEIDPYVFHGFAKVDNLNSFNHSQFFSQQLNNVNRKYIELYVGEDMDNHYENFFVVNDVALNEDNILLFRPLIMLYAGYVQSGNTNTSLAFRNYLKTNIFTKTKSVEVGGSISRRDYFLNILTGNFPKLNIVNKTDSGNIIIGYENVKLKLEQYNFFKSFNDKWIGGNSIGQRLLLEEFLFLDKANKDIGDVFYLNLTKLTQLDSHTNDKTNLYNVISKLIEGTGLDMRPLPSYINFYGVDAKNKTKPVPSKKVAQNLFGTYLEVDYLESSPKVIIQLVGNNSKHPDVPNPDYKFVDDSFDLSSTNNNPLIITNPSVFNEENLVKSNRCVAFEVSFGDQNQNIFKGVQLDQTSLKNTTESFTVLENIARSESGAGAYNVDISLFDYYRQASYTCEVTCLGNALIQPTMFFYLKNIPIFKGSYWILEVNHSIRANTFTTTFKGARIPQSSLPDPKDSFISSYRTLFDKIRRSALSKVKSESASNTQTTYQIPQANGKVSEVKIINKQPFEDLPKIINNVSDISEFGLPYNGFLNENNIHYINYQGVNFYRAIAVEIGGVARNYPLESTSVMQLVANAQNGKNVTWGQISGTSQTQNFYICKFQYPNTNIKIQNTLSAKTKFYNPKDNIESTEITYSLTEQNNQVYLQGPIGIGPTSDRYSVGLSNKLMKDLKLVDGDVVYFRMYK